ncbi:hypothetical protein F2P56_010432, partial [Juglans regia]
MRRGRSKTGIKIWIRVRVRVRVRAALGIERWVTAEVEAETTNEVDKIGAGVDPVLEVRNGDDAGGVNERVGALDDHVAGGVDVDTGRVAGVGLHEPENDGDVVGETLERHGDGAFGLEKVDRTAVVMGEGSSFGFEGRAGGGKGEQVLADQPLGVLRVREGGGPSLGKDRAQELLGLLWVRRGWTRLHRRWHHSNCLPCFPLLCCFCVKVLVLSWSAFENAFWERNEIFTGKE